MATTVECNEEHGVYDSQFMSYEDLMRSRKITFLDIKEHITGPVLSTILHVFLLSFLGTVIVFKAPRQSKEVAVGIKTIKLKSIHPPPPPPMLELPDPTELETAAKTSVEKPNLDLSVDVKIDNISIEDTSDVELPTILNMKMNNSALKLAVPVGGGGKKVAGRFLGTGGTGSRFAFVIDYSCSMGRHSRGVGKIDIMKDHLIKAITHMRGSGQVCIIAFAGTGWLIDGKRPLDKDKSTEKVPKCYKVDPEEIKPRWICPTRHNLQLLKKKIYETDSLYGTDWASGMDIALNYLQPKPDVVFFMTDGQVSEVNAKRTLQMVKEAKKSYNKLIVNTIAFGITGDTRVRKSKKKVKSKKKSSRCDPNFYLPEIAKATGGECKVYTKSEIKKMTVDINKVIKYDAKGELDYSPPKRSKKIPKEKEVTGLIIE